MDHQESREKLRMAGFSPREINRLLKLRQKCILDAPPNMLVVRRRLEFARWLFRMGKLTEAS